MDLGVVLGAQKVRFYKDYMMRTLRFTFHEDALAQILDHFSFSESGFNENPEEVKPVDMPDFPPVYDSIMTRKHPTYPNNGLT
jgi:hypothetical protein